MRKINTHVLEVIMKTGCNVNLCCTQICDTLPVKWQFDFIYFRVCMLKCMPMIKRRGRMAIINVSGLKRQHIRNYWIQIQTVGHEGHTQSFNVNKSFSRPSLLFTFYNVFWNYFAQVWYTITLFWRLYLKLFRIAAIVTLIRILVI